MKKVLLFALALSIGVSLAGCAGGGAASTPYNSPQVTKSSVPPQASQQAAGIPEPAQAGTQKLSETKNKTDDQKNRDDVTMLVSEFGLNLQLVPLLASPDVLEKSMKENYGKYVSPDLIAKWMKDPQHAPGRLTSSPWPDRIDIQTVDKISDTEYKVSGEVIEITSSEKTGGGIAAKRPITLDVKKNDGGWQIVDVTLGDYEQQNQIVYENTKYGFQFTLPESWKGYKITEDKWEGLSIDGTTGEKVVATGPLLSIRHPLWTEQNPRQDIPIMVFTLAQWNDLQKDKFHIGAAPIGPSELGRNNKYVFALPARYNFAFPTGYEEVEDILKGKPLKPITVK